MKKQLLDEREFQEYILERLVSDNGFVQRNSQSFDPVVAMDRELLLQFLNRTQPEKMKKLRDTFKEDTDETIIQFINSKLTSANGGLINILKNGVEINHQKLTLMYTKPATSFNEKAMKMYGCNIFSVMEEVWASPKERIDLVLFLNGLPIVSMELKCNQSGQPYENAITQYRTQRNPKTRLFLFKAGCLVNFAMDLQEVYMTTKLDGEKTYFLPFNQGQGEGVNSGKGNPIYEDGSFSVKYMWEDIFQKDTLLDIISQYVFVEKSEKEDPKTHKMKERELLIFPRYHQLRCIRKLLADVVEHHSEENYLIQHSTGSGKTKTIAWLAHRLFTQHDINDNVIFDTVVIITDHIVVDRQLQSAIKQLDHKAGVIRVMDDRCNSDDLRRALEGNTKIIATTIQKFLYIIATCKSLQDKHFAVIIDEAHSSTAGKDMSAVTKVLGQEQQEDEELDLQDIIEQEQRRSGKQPNVSMFAFTATPKATTLQLFGRPGRDGKNRAFDLYSMKQAIEEGFIIDVLQNYIEYKTYFNLNKTIAEDPKYKNAKAKKQIAHLVDITDENIEKRTAIIIEHFRNNVMQELGGTAKAMVITASRQAAVKFTLAFQKYIEEHDYKDMQAITAFSGKVKLDEFGDKEFTEPGMNGFAENRLPDKFDENDDYRVLIVANKYQTGFDQKRLVAMYVLKKFKGIAAVQTLSRLNRICEPYQKKTFVLDFCNTYDDVIKSFEPYYTTTILENSLTPEDIYKVETQLDAFQVLDEYDIEMFSEFMYKPSLTTKEKNQMEAYLQRAAKRANELKDDKRKEFVAVLKRFVRLYEFIMLATQIGEEGDIDLHRKYKFCSALQSWFKQSQPGQGFDLKDQIIANNFTNKLEGEHTDTTVVSDPYISLPTANTQLTEDEEKELSKIIEEINARHGNKFDSDLGVKAMLQIKELLLKSDKLKQSAHVNSERDFRFTYFDDIDDALTEGYEQNQQLFNLLLENDDLKKQVLGVFITEVYKTLKNKD